MLFRIFQARGSALESNNLVRPRCLTALLGLLLAGGCATLPPALDQPEDESPAVEVPEVAKRKPVPPKIYPVAPFDKVTLYELLVAEVAGYRNQYDVALKHYGEQAKLTRDPGVAARATRLAVYLKRDDVTIDTAQIWAEVDPDSIEAHRYAAEQLVRSGQLEEAVSHMEAVKELGGLANFDRVAIRATRLDPQAKESLLQTISEMLLRFPNDSQLLFSQAVLMEGTDRAAEALAVTDQLLTPKRDVNVIILRVNILRQLERTAESIEFLEGEVIAQPDNRALREFFARVLFEESDLDRAREQYEELLALSPKDSSILFALALIAMEQEQDDVAGDYFRRMVKLERRAGEAHYYLGTIAEENGNTEIALEEYGQVSTGYEFIPSSATVYVNRSEPV